MKIKVRANLPNPQPTKKAKTIRQKYKNYRLASYILAASWIIAGIIYYGQKIW